MRYCYTAVSIVTSMGQSVGEECEVKPKDTKHSRHCRCSTQTSSTGSHHTIKCPLVGTITSTYTDNLKFTFNIK